MRYSKSSLESLFSSVLQGGGDFNSDKNNPSGQSRKLILYRSYDWRIAKILVKLYDILDEDPETADFACDLIVAEQIAALEKEYPDLLR